MKYVLFFSSLVVVIEVFLIKIFNFTLLLTKTDRITFFDAFKYEIENKKKEK